MKTSAYAAEARKYGMVLASLLVLTAVTVAAARVHFPGAGNVVAALAIATVKATLVALFFMHLAGGRPLHVLVFTAGLVFLGTLLLLCLVDVETRLPVAPSRAPAAVQAPGVKP